MRSGEPSRISLRKRWISLTLRARLKWLAGVIHIAQMLCVGWNWCCLGTFNKEEGENWYEDFYHHLRMEMDEYRRLKRSLRVLKSYTDYEEDLYEEAV